MTSLWTNEIHLLNPTDGKQIQLFAMQGEKEEQIGPKFEALPFGKAYVMASPIFYFAWKIFSNYVFS